MMEEPFLPLIYPTRRIAMQVGIGGFLFSLIGGYFQPQAFFLSYLFAYLFWLGIALGAMAIVMVHHLTGGVWGQLTHRLLEAAAQTLPLMALLFIPLLFGLSDLYVWVRPEGIAEEMLLKEKRGYLNVPFFLTRAVIYFIVWWGLIHWLSKWSDEQLQNPQPEITSRLQRLSAAGLIIYGLSITFAAVDWVMSLIPQWYSTVFGLLWGVGQTVSALAFAIIVAAFFSQNYSLAKLFTPERFHDLGNLLLLLILLWAYLAFMQYLIVWSGNLPHEIAWYLPRLQGEWQGLTVAVFILHFVLPFMVLLFRQAKCTISILAGVAAVVLLAHLIESFWLIVPSLRTSSLQFYWSDFIAPLGIGGLWLATVLGQIQKKPLLVIPLPPSKS
jgi:hypothetical protein